MKTVKTAAILLIPLVLLLIMMFTYEWIWEEGYIYNRFGCPCSNPDFNSNDVTFYVWNIVSAVIVLISILCSFSIRAIRKKLWPLQIAYIAVIAWLCFSIGSFFITYYAYK